jgi:recombinational DNA repair protein RecR
LDPNKRENSKQSLTNDVNNSYICKICKKTLENDEEPCCSKKIRQNKSIRIVKRQSELEEILIEEMKYRDIVER